MLFYLDGLRVCNDDDDDDDNNNNMTEEYDAMTMTATVTMATAFFM
jgi:hypothetical protein